MSRQGRRGARGDAFAVFKSWWEPFFSTFFFVFEQEEDWKLEKREDLDQKASNKPYSYEKEGI